MDKLITIGEVCEMFRITRQTEHRFRKQGLLKPSIQKGRFVRYTMNDLKSTIEDGK